MTDSIFNPKFLERMKTLLGNSYDEFLKSIQSNNNIRGLRVNTKKISVKNFIEISPYKLKKIGYNSDGFILFDDVQMGGEVYHQAGMFYMQEPSAMIPINSIKIAPNWKVLDLCAAPGGKTTQISNELSNEGLVISNDVKFTRCRALVDNVERLGLDNVIITSASAEDICQNFQNYFDLVLIDATCSGEGMFRKNLNLAQTWSEKNIQRCVSIQSQLLNQASKTLKKNGILVYSTCTFSIEENEGSVLSFLTEHNEFELIEVNDIVKQVTVDGYKIDEHFPLEKTRRFFPHIAEGEGQFVAVFKKLFDDGKSFCREAKVKENDEQVAEVKQFLTQLGINSIECKRIYIKSNQIWILPKTNVILKKNVLRYGVKLGEFENGEIVPSHSFFMAFGHLFSNIVSLNINDERLSKYLEGRDISASCRNGWGSIEVCGCIIGGFRARNGFLTNYYPQNLTNKDIFNHC